MPAQTIELQEAEDSVSLRVWNQREVQVATAVTS
jgi:hypothetical protein